MTNQNIVINNLNDVSALIERAKNNRDLDINTVKINLAESINFKVFGDMEKYNGSIPSSMAQGMCEFQTEIYKVFSLIKYGTDNLKRLTKEDKESLEVIFKVEEGCTDVIAALTDLVKALGGTFNEVTQGMTGIEKVISLTLIMLILTGGWLLRSRQKDSHDEKIKQQELDSQKSDNESRIEEMRVLKDGMVEILQASNASNKSKEISEGIQDHATNACIGMLKGVSDAEKVEFSGSVKTTLTNSDIKSIIQSPRDKLQHIEQSILVDIEVIKKHPEKLTLTCTPNGQDYTFQAYVDTEFFSDSKEKIDQLFDSMRDSKSVKLFGSYKIRSGIIESVMVTEIE